MGNKDNIKQVRGLMDSLTNRAMSPYKLPRKDSDSVVALSENTLSKIDKLVNTILDVLKASEGDAELLADAIAEGVSTTLKVDIKEDSERLALAIESIYESPVKVEFDASQILAVLSEIKDRLSDGGIVEAMKEGASRTVQVHLDNADNLVQPQPVIVSIGDDIRQIVESIARIGKPEVVIKELDHDFTKLIAAINDRPISVTIDKGESDQKDWEFVFVRDENKLTQKIIAKQV